jgi:hypothetical protein
MGKPKRLGLSSFILLSPESMMKLDGLSMRAAFTLTGKETVFKGLERFLKVRPLRIPTTLKVNMKCMLDGMLDFEAKTHFLSGLDGDERAIEKINQLGSWEVFRRAFPSTSQGGDGLWIDHCVEVEKASIEIDALLQKGAYATAAAAVRTNQTVAPYVSANAIERLMRATSDAEALLPRVAGLCEFLLALIARLDVVLALGGPQQKPMATYQYLLQADVIQTCSPGRELYQWLKRALVVQTFSELQKISTRANGMPTVDISTLKRWSQGAEFPREDKLRLVLGTIAQNRGHSLDDESYREIALHYWVARRLHKLLELVRSFWLKRATPSGMGCWSSLLEYPTAEQWVQERYVFWLWHWYSFKAGVDPKRIN